MTLTEFCINASTTDFFKHSVYVLRSKQYSPLFFHKFLQFIQPKLDSDLKKIDLDLALDDIKRQLETTFLGQTYVYWFLDGATSKKKTEILSYLTQYQGPHIVVGMMMSPESDIVASRGILIDIQDSYSSDQVTKLSFLYGKERPEVVAYFMGKLYRNRKEYSIEQLAMLLQYVSLLGKNTELFFEQWLDQIVVSDVSLYYLSQLFFEKNSAEFFDVWAKVRPLYPDQFWTAFFSEQLFKAYWYVSWGGRVAPEAKAITFGLPFSFLKHDWRSYRAPVLQQAHQKIYEIDLLLKLGSLPLRFDLFFMQFFKGF